MKNARISTTTLVVLLLGFVLPALAGQDRPAQDHPKQEKTRQQTKPEQQTRRQRPSGETQRQTAQQQQQTYQRQNQRATAQQRTQQQQNQRSAAQRQTQQRKDQRAVTQERTNQQQDRRAVAQQRTWQTQQVRQAAWQQHRAHNWQADHRSWQQRGGYHGYRIPDDRFRGYFGADHGFRIGGLPFLVVGGYPRFQYNGYWLSVVDPWPQQWGDNWYDNDDVYVVYTDSGYYLYNRRYPGIGLAVSISR